MALTGSASISFLRFRDKLLVRLVGDILAFVAASIVIVIITIPTATAGKQSMIFFSD